MSLKQRHISHPVVLTQSYDSVTDKYSETFSAALVRITNNTRVRIKHLLNQGFYFKTVNAIDTPVSLAFALVDESPGDIAKGIFEADNTIALQADPHEGSFSSYTGLNPEILEIAPNDLELYRPHRFAFFNVDAAKYNTGSAQGILKNYEVLSSLLVQGTSFPVPFELHLTTQKQYLLLLAYIAGLKKTELACSLRISFDFEEEEIEG